MEERENQITYFAETNFRNFRRRFGIRRRDRRHHMYVLGKTGTGKTTMLTVLAQQDIQNRNGFAFLDPHGDAVEHLVAAVPPYRQKDLIYLDVPNPQNTLGFNPLYGVPQEKRPLVAAGLIEVFKKIWTDSWGARLEHILRNSLLALLDQPEASIADVLRLLDDEAYRRVVVRRVTNPQVLRFWQEEYEKYTSRYRAEAAGPIQNKIGAFLADPPLNRILTNPRSSFNLRELMDGGKILLVNLAKGKIGEGPSALLGSMLVAQLGSTGLSRADIPEVGRRDFYLYLDEFQTFTTQSLAGMLSELRKYRVNLILANQHLSQVDKPLAEAILGNVGTLVSFRVGPHDAPLLAKEFEPPFRATDLLSLPNHHIYVKLMIDGAVSQPFSADALRNTKDTNARER